MAKRKSGWGICGSFLGVVPVVWFVSRDDLPESFGPHESWTLLLFTAYAIVRTVPSANRPNRRKKKVTLAKVLLFGKAAPFFAKKRSLQQPHFRGRKHIGFLDSKKWPSPVWEGVCIRHK